MASNFFSFEFLGSSLKPSRPTTHLWRSVNRTVSGSTSGNLSAKAIAMSSVVVHVNDLLIVDFPHTLVLQRLCNRRVHDHLCQMHGRIAQPFDCFANSLMIVTPHGLSQVFAGGGDFCLFLLR